METLVLIAPNLIGFVLPPVVELLNKDVQSETQRYLIALLTCLFVAVILHWNQIAYGTPEEALTYMAIIFVECNTVYKLYFANSWLRGKMQSSQPQEDKTQ